MKAMEVKYIMAQDPSMYIVAWWHGGAGFKDIFIKAETVVAGSMHYQSAWIMQWEHIGAKAGSRFRWKAFIHGLRRIVTINQS